MENSNKTKTVDISEVVQVLDSYLLVDESEEKPYLILDGVKIIL
jgi:hypothetical protein